MSDDIIDIGEFSSSWTPTMSLRWIDSDKANNSKLGIKYTNSDTGWGWPYNITLQQKWISDDGGIEWRDVELFNE